MGLWYGRAGCLTAESGGFRPGQSPRTVLPLDGNSIIVGDWKLLLGSVGESGWTGYVYPNASTAAPVTCVQRSKYTL